MSYSLSVLLGSLVGLSTGLSGAGGSLLAIPLLVYGLSFAPREAFATSLAATGVACLVGVVPRMLAKQVEPRTGICFALAGMVGAPPGTWFAARISETVLLAALSILMFGVSIRMLQQSRQRSPRSDSDSSERQSGTWVILVAGLATGFMSGTFGVGCGFVIVPAMVLLAGMNIHRAVGTALLVMGIVSTTGAVSYFVSGRGLGAPVLSALFIGGAAMGVVLGGLLANQMSAITLKRVFSAVIFSAAVLLITRTFLFESFQTRL
jgi:uncharacterized membrane protein YfcA